MSAGVAAQQRPGMRTNVDTFRLRLVRFYTRYAPEKIPSIDGTIRNFDGREDELFAALQDKYGPEIADGGDNDRHFATTSQSSSASSTLPSADGYRSRLVRFYQHYAPEKLANVDRALEQYRGNEHVMFQTLVERYGPEPAASRAAGTLMMARAATIPVEQVAGTMRVGADVVSASSAVVPGVQEGEEGLSLEDEERFRPAPPGLPPPVVDPARAALVDSYRCRLLSLYRVRAPSRVGTVEAALQRYEGQEDVLLQEVIERFGPEPEEADETPPTALPISADVQQHRGAATVVTAPDSPEHYPPPLEVVVPEPTSAPGSAEEPASDEEAMPDGDTEEEGDEDEDDEGDEDDDDDARHAYYRERLVNFYLEHAPEKVATVDATLLRYLGCEDQLFEKLSQKYVAAPPHQQQPPASQAQAHVSASLHRDRLLRFYRHHAPEKIASADAALERYRGQEDLMFETLVRKYGPEPPMTPDPPSVDGAAIVVGPIGVRPTARRAYDEARSTTQERSGAPPAADHQHQGASHTAPPMVAHGSATAFPLPPATNSISESPDARRPYEGTTVDADVRAHRGEHLPDRPADDQGPAVHVAAVDHEWREFVKRSRCGAMAPPAAIKPAGSGRPAVTAAEVEAWETDRESPPANFWFTMEDRAAVKIQALLRGALARAACRRWIELQLCAGAELTGSATTSQHHDRHGEAMAKFAALEARVKQARLQELAAHQEADRKQALEERRRLAAAAARRHDENLLAAEAKARNVIRSLQAARVAARTAATPLNPSAAHTAQSRAFQSNQGDAIEDIIATPFASCVPTNVYRRHGRGIAGASPATLIVQQSLDSLSAKAAKIVGADRHGAARAALLTGASSNAVPSSAAQWTPTQTVSGIHNAASRRWHDGHMQQVTERWRRMGFPAD